MTHQQGVIVVGETPPAMSVSWERPTSPADSGYLVIFSEVDPDDEADLTPSSVVCLHCLVQDGDEQLGRGLDLARQHGRVDWDSGVEEWFVVAED